MNEQGSRNGKDSPEMGGSFFDNESLRAVIGAAAPVVLPGLFTLKDIYLAEKQIVKALPKMAKKASSEDLSDAFNTHLEETIVHVEQLEQVFTLIDKASRGKKCEAILGIIKEAGELMEEAETDTVRDADMVGAAQAVEHYEISRYGTLIAWAEKLGCPMRPTFSERHCKRKRQQTRS